jgi:rhodanese-related sulfurtransferase
MKGLLREVAGIVVIASILAFAYNAFNPQGIPLLRKEQRLAVVDDSTLQRELGLASAPPNAPSSSQDNPTEQAPAEPGNSSVGASARREVAEAGAARKTTQPAVQPAESLPQEPRIRAVRYEQVLQLLQHPEVLIIDARRPEDYAAGHIPGARNVFAYDFPAHIPEFITLPRTKPILIYCDGGQCELSHYLAEQLQNLGFQRLYIYEGGWEEWQRRRSE